MPKISTYKISNGERILLSENEVSQEQYDRIKERFGMMKKDKKERMQRKFDEVPEIHWEILRFANTHKKEDVLAAYPEHIDFISKIVFNS